MDRQDAKGAKRKFFPSSSWRAWGLGGSISGLEVTQAQEHAGHDHRHGSISIVDLAGGQEPGQKACRDAQRPARTERRLVAATAGHDEAARIDTGEPPEPA